MSSTKTSLSNLHTFQTNNACDELIKINSTQNIYEFITNQPDKKFMILGGGSNVLFTKDFDGIILQNNIKGIEVVDEDENNVLVKVGAGEKWHQFVMWTISHKLWGLENLSLIPGSVGAAPMQNIGAYGVEQDRCFHSLIALDLETGVNKIFFKYNCNFGYRESIFKHELKNKVFITHVTYMLSKKPNPILDYADIKERVGQENIHNIKKISDAIIEVRQSKLPDPELIGNAGSFFKNPIISKEEFEKIKLNYPTIVNYPTQDGKMKLAAGWLIDQAGFKGFRSNNTGTYKNQALVIVNHGGATGEEIYAFAQTIQQGVLKKFAVLLEIEVNIIE
jgi:UDP-N-acetylmuramate dehydrogenase